MRHAVAWSYDLLDDDERDVLGHCSVFADGFDLAGAVYICGDGEGLDEYAVLDLLDSLVRKSLIVAEQLSGRTRYGMLETIRQFAEDQLAATGLADEVRNRHATYFAEQVVAYWVGWDGPEQRVALDWVDVEFANLRAAYRWASDEADLVNAAYQGPARRNSPDGRHVVPPNAGELGEVLAASIDFPRPSACWSCRALIVPRGAPHSFSDSHDSLTRSRELPQHAADAPGRLAAVARLHAALLVAEESRARRARMPGANVHLEA